MFFLFSLVNDHPPLIPSKHHVCKSVNVHPREMVSGKDRREKFTRTEGAPLGKLGYGFQLNKSEVENGLCIHRNPAGWPFSLRPPKGNCPAAEVAPSPNLPPCQVLDVTASRAPVLWGLTS